MSDEEFDENTLGGEEHFEEGEEEERGVESDRETVPLSAPNKRIKEIPIDRLSELPDSLLVHILSFLGVKEAGITSVLSKRWKFLWAELPKLEFCENWEAKKKHDFVTWVNRTIDTRRRGYLERFLVKFINYDKCFASDLDDWIEFSVKNKVKELILMLFPCGTGYYTPPQMMYSCSSLTALHLSGCIMAYERTIGWQSLTDLTLSEVELNQHLLDEILSSCPVLSRLELEECWGFNRLEVISRCLDRLTIEEFGSEPFLEISAPYIRSLNITVNPQGRKWQLRNISSVVKASIKFFELDGDCSVEVMSNAKEFLEQFNHVNYLDVGNVCFEVLSIMAGNGWQLPQLKLRHLTITSFSEYEHIISGIICLLESSPNLETLLLEGYETDGEIVDLDPAAKGDLDGDLLHLKEIRVNNLADQNGEPLLTLARILLSRAPALEEMVIVIDVEDTSDFVNIAQTLLTYPRSSTKAKIHLLSSN
ncbi:hypothetical protein ACS0TY_025007 [Phlomoides rotata]